MHIEKNLIHGDIFMMAPYFTFFGVATFGLPWYFAFIIAIAITTVLGMAIEFSAYRPLRSAPKIFTDVVVIGGVSIQNLTFIIPVVTVILLFGLLYSRVNWI